jgi:hypothetical protein
MHPPRSLRAVGLLAVGVATGLVFWLAAAPPATSTVAPDAPHAAALP